MNQFMKVMAYFTGISHMHLETLRRTQNLSTFFIPHEHSNSKSSEQKEKCAILQVHWLFN